MLCIRMREDDQSLESFFSFLFLHSLTYKSRESFFCSSHEDICRYHCQCHNVSLTKNVKLHNSTVKIVQRFIIIYKPSLLECNYGSLNSVSFKIESGVGGESETVEN